MKWFKKTKEIEKGDKEIPIAGPAPVDPSQVGAMGVDQAIEVARNLFNTVQRKVISEAVGESFGSLNRLLDDRSSKALNVGGREWVENDESRAERMRILEWVRDSITVNLVWDTYAGYTGKYVVSFDERKLQATAPESVRRVLTRREALALEEMVRQAVSAGNE